MTADILILQQFCGGRKSIIPHLPSNGFLVRSCLFRYPNSRREEGILPMNYPQYIYPQLHFCNIPKQRSIRRTPYGGCFFAEGEERVEGTERAEEREGSREHGGKSGSRGDSCRGHRDSPKAKYFGRTDRNSLDNVAQATVLRYDEGEERERVSPSPGKRKGIKRHPRGRARHGDRR